MIEAILAAVVLLVCCAMLVLMALGSARRQRLQRWWRRLRSSENFKRASPLQPESRPGSARRAPPRVERNGNVYRPKSFNGRKPEDPPNQ